MPVPESEVNPFARSNGSQLHYSGTLSPVSTPCSFMFFHVEICCINISKQSICKKKLKGFHLTLWLHNNEQQKLIQVEDQQVTVLAVFICLFVFVCIFILSCICICRLYFKFLAVFVFVDICICICRLYFKFLVVFVFVDKGKVEAAGKFQGSSEWVGWPPLLTDTPPLHSYSPSHHPQHPSPPSIHFLLFSWFYQPLPHFTKSNSSHFLLIPISPSSSFPSFYHHLPRSSLPSSLTPSSPFSFSFPPSFSSIKTQYFLQNQLYVCLQNLTSLMTALVRLT